MNLLDYTIPVTPRALEVLSRIYSLPKQTHDDLKRERDQEINRLEEQKQRRFPSWYKTNKDFIEDGVVFTKNFFDDLKRLKKLKAAKKLSPKSHSYVLASKFDGSDSLQDELRLQRTAIQSHLRRQLYGLVGVVYNYATSAEESSTNDRTSILFKPDGTSVTRKRGAVLTQTGLFIPSELDKAVQTLIDSEQQDGQYIYEGTIQSTSLPALQYIFDRSTQLREHYGSRWYPRFTITEIAKNTRMNRTAAKTATRDLLGITGDAIIPCDNIRYQRFSFLPASRFEIAKRLLST